MRKIRWFFQAVGLSLVILLIGYLIAAYFYLQRPEPKFVIVGPREAEATLVAIRCDEFVKIHAQNAVALGTTRTYQLGEETYQVHYGVQDKILLVLSPELTIPFDMPENDGVTTIMQVSQAEIELRMCNGTLYVLDEEASQR